MIKKTLLAISALALAFSSSMAQTVQTPCGTNERQAELEAYHPEIAQIRAALEEQIKAGLKKMDINHFAKTTKTTLSLDDTTWYDIPIVVHVIHDYGRELNNLSDDDIFSALTDWNITYAGANADTANVIAPFKKYLGNPHIRLHFATKDPNGNPTKGITHFRSYLSNHASDYAKFQDWPPQSYINIWFVGTFAPSNNSTPAAYAYEPPDAAVQPYYDGVIALSDYLLNNGGSDVGGRCINHEIGHMLNLEHPWGNNNSQAVACGDDEVDDTPPTKGHNPGCTPAALYDTSCSLGYYKSYPSSISGVDSFVDYPDTNNSQNIMDYTYCALMFTKGQVYRMHAALQSEIAGRDSIWSVDNLAATGALAPRPDLAIIPDFNVIQQGSNAVENISTNYFGTVHTSFIFQNHSWNDTLASSNWTFSNGASIPSSTLLTNINEKFSQPGWVTVTLTAQGNNTAAQTIVDSQMVFIADSNATNPQGYFQEFNPNGDLAKWPIYNYYDNNNGFKWQTANVGYYDNTSMEFTGFDSRIYPDTKLGSPTGDYSDFFSVPFDLSAYSPTDPLNLDFMFSGATRTAYSLDMNDTLEIDYSINNATTWTVLKKMSKVDMLNKGTIATAYTPQSQSDWAPMTINIPANARKPYTLFRFRYRPSADGTYYTDANEYNLHSTGNNFYMDRITISQYPAGVENVTPAANNIAVLPNPTNGPAYVLIKDMDNTMADIRVTDITGKTVYTTHQQISGVTRVTIPQAYISVKGMYLVQVITGNQSHTEKLVVY